MASGPDLGTRIKRARERLRLSQQQLADRLGVDRKSVDNWENGRTRPRSSLGALEAVLGSLDGTPGNDRAALMEAIRNSREFTERQKRKLLELLERDLAGNDQ